MKLIILRQISSILWKNYMLKKSHIFSFLAELLLPVLFMTLLIWIKSVTEVYDSPNVAYYCGNTYPWYYSSSALESALSSNHEPFECSQKPSSCNVKNYYQYEESIDQGAYSVSGYVQYGYITSAIEYGNPLYSYTIADESTLYNDIDATNPSLPFDKILYRLFHFRSLFAIAPKNNNDEESIEQAINLFNHVKSTVPNISNSTVKYFDSESELDNYITNHHYNTPGYKDGKIGMAVVINSVDIINVKWDYSIRLNYTNVQDEDDGTVACLAGNEQLSHCSSCKFTYQIPSTKYYTEDLYKPQDAGFMYGYTYTGFATIQQFVDEFIFSQYSNDVIDITSTVSLMPTNAYVTDTFQYVIESTLGIFYMLSFLYPVSRIVRALVIEKETRVREGMKMMGLTDFAYNISWLITLVLQMTFVSLLITIVTANSVFEYSNKVLVFLYFEAFSLAVINMCFLMATFFSRAKVASLLGPLIFFGSFFPYYSVSDEQFSIQSKAASCLLAPTCFALGSTVFADYEGGQTGVQSSNSSEYIGNFSYSLCVGMLIVDSIIYGVLAWYLDKVLPSEFGFQLPFYFPLLPSYWFGEISINDSNNLYTPLSTNDAEKSMSTQFFENVSDDLLNQRDDKRAVVIQGLRKVYQTSGADRIAVDNIFGEFYEGQVTVLLGHNGAGKSTTINMLVGMTNPSAGDAIMRGLSINKDMQKIRQQLGVCPQHDILFPELTVLQHLQIFASCKGVPSTLVNEESHRMIAEVGLIEKTNVKASSLSGGQKRKLSLGIALIGDSKIVILDEPTSGMDPYSRRSTWNIIQRNKKGRVILLTTHFMDEADILGDRIAIMAEGRIKCFGSSLFLKNVFGVGYTLTISKLTQTQNSSIIKDIVINNIPESEPLSDVGTEQSFRLPFTSTNKFTKLFTLLDKEKSKSLTEYGISVTTLEEVFLRVGKGHFDDLVVNNVSKDVVIPKRIDVPSLDLRPIVDRKHEFNQSTNKYNLNDSIFYQHFYAMLKKRVIYGRRDKRMFMCQLVLPVALVILGLCILLIIPNFTQPDLVLSPVHYNPTLKSEYRNFVPINIYKTDDYTSSNYAQKMYDRFNGDPSNGVFGVAVDASVVDDSNIDYFSSCSQGASPLFNTSNFLLSPAGRSEKGSSRYGAITVDDSKTNETSLVYNIMVNGTANHGVGVYTNLVHQSYLQVLTGVSSATITTRNFPLPRTYSEISEVGTEIGFVVALFMSIAFCFIPASFGSFVVKEFETKAKFQQIISGLNIYAYWCATLVWDVMSYLPTAFFVYIALLSFQVDAFIKNDGSLATIIILLLYCPAIASLTYILSYCFKSHSTAQIVIMFFNFLTGLCCMITSFVLTNIPSTSKLSVQLRYFFRIFPSFCFGDSLLLIAICTDGKSCPAVTEYGYDFTVTQSPFAWDVVGANIFFLSIECILYFLIVLTIEYLLTFPVLISWLHSVDDNGVDPNFYSDEDIDVAAERRRVSNGLADNDVVTLKELRKLYPINVNSAWNLINKLMHTFFNIKSSSNSNNKIAVQSLSFGIPKGECFGFLGINGAGKTTTLSILSGEFPPTSGTAYIDRCDIREDQSKIRRKIGYCPQFDALLELLTVREHLEMYASIKGVTETNLRLSKKSRTELLNDVVNNKIAQLDLIDFEDKTAGSLSGGNKRKLSVAIALIGDPSIVYLDEPSTGMDPQARRFMWDVISKVSTRDGLCSVILTTHSMAEAEALCTRIGVMVSGRLKCLGNGQHLKERFGNGYEVNIKTKTVSNDEIDVLINRIVNLYDTTDHRLNLHQVSQVCSLLNHPERFQLISPNRSGEIIFDTINVERTITYRALSSWWITEDQSDSINIFINQFQSIGLLGSLLERSSLHNYTYRLQLNDDISKLPSIALIFDLFEQNKESLNIQEYSVGQTTLEAIFNHFASSQENPEVKAIKRNDNEDVGSPLINADYGL